MTNSTASSLPLQLGTSLLTLLGRLGQWIFARFMTNPVQNSGLIVLAIALTFSASNALFWQTGRHPAPLFSTGTSAPAFIGQPEAPHPAPLPAPLRDRTTSAVEIQAPAQPAPSLPLEEGLGHEVNNDQLRSAQTILSTLGLYEGKIDGFYGPATAAALRAFELRNGYPPKGALTPEIISKILAAPTNNQPSAPRVIASEQVAVRTALQETTPPAQTPEPQLAEQPHTADPLAIIAQSVAAQNGTVPAPLVTAAVQPAAAQPVDTAQPLPAPLDPSVDSELIKKIQRGLSSLAFLHGAIDGVAGDETARAIREFEVFNNLQVTGRISPELVDLLISVGAAI